MMNRFAFAAVATLAVILVAHVIAQPVPQLRLLWWYCDGNNVHGEVQNTGNITLEFVRPRATLHAADGSSEVMDGFGPNGAVFDTDPLPPGQRTTFALIHAGYDTEKGAPTSFVAVSCSDVGFEWAHRSEAGWSRNLIITEHNPCPACDKVIEPGHTRLEYMDYLIERFIDVGYDAESERLCRLTLDEFKEDYPERYALIKDPVGMCRADALRREMNRNRKAIEKKERPKEKSRKAHKQNQPNGGD
jgi:hypothetical protein